MLRPGSIFNGLLVTRERGGDAAVFINPYFRSYLSIFMLAIFVASFLLYLEYNTAAIVLLVVSAAALPFLAFADRLKLDAKRLSRTGPVSRLWNLVTKHRLGLKLKDIEQIETRSLRSIKRGGNVAYRYRTAVRGKGLNFTFVSGGEEYRRFAHKLFSSVPEDCLDTRSLELRDYLSDPDELMERTESAQIPSADVLRQGFGTLRQSKKRDSRSPEVPAADPERAAGLRKLGNELRVLGFLPQALEAFRRALLLSPNDGWLLFDFARCLQAVAVAERDDRAARRSLAAMRLAERRGAGDERLLTRLGEAYFRAGQWRRAEAVFRGAQVDEDAGFRSTIGLAEIALREGKLAHVVHKFAAASRVAMTSALRRWTNSEADYFARLTDDDEYMELEISRIKLLDKFDRLGRFAARMIIWSVPVIVFGIVADDGLIADVGWGASFAAIVMRLVAWGGVRLFAERIQYDMVRSDD